MTIRRVRSFVVVSALIFTGLTQTSNAQSLVLNGTSLTPSEVVSVAKLETGVSVDAAAWQRVRRSFDVLIGAAEACQKIYGLTTGVGANKDRDSLDDTEDKEDEQCKNEPLTDETIRASREFNKHLLFAHSAAVGAPLEPEVVRALLLIRLNTALLGGAGMQEQVVQRLIDYLAYDILPVIPSRGSVGEADITVLSHVGLTMIGEWDVVMQGERMPADEAMRRVGLAPVDFVAKDALASFSSNAFGAALATIGLSEMRQVSRLARLVYSLSLEGLDGNVSPLLPENGAMRPFPFMIYAANDLRQITAGSYLYEPSETRPLQDPLSYRTFAYQLGSFDRALAELENVLTIQINGADDNPLVYLGDIDPVTASMPEIRSVVREEYQGAVVASANFSPLPLAIAVQTVGIAAAHVSHGATMRTLKLVNPAFTHLTDRRFLANEPGAHAFGAIHKPIIALMSENRELANPVSLDFAPVAMDIEDMATNTPRTARRMRQMADNLMTLLGFELMHAAQAIDLRLQQDSDLQLSPITRQFYDEYRSHVLFLEADDRILTEDIAASAMFIKNCFLNTDDYDQIDWSTQLDDGTVCGF